MLLPLPTCVLVSCALLPPGWRHTAVETLGSPPSCGRWRQRGTARWTCSPLGTRTAPWTRTRTVWRCCWTSCFHTGHRQERRTQGLWVRCDDTEPVLAQDKDISCLSMTVFRNVKRDIRHFQWMMRSTKAVKSRPARSRLFKALHPHFILQSLHLHFNDCC